MQVRLIQFLGHLVQVGLNLADLNQKNLIRFGCQLVLFQKYLPDLSEVYKLG